MRRVLVDSENKVIYEGVDSKEVLKVLLAHPADVTEEDEVKFEEQLRNLSWSGKLKYEVHFDLKFRGIDDWNRPVFKDVDSSLYFGDTNKLFDWSADAETVSNYYRNDPSGLEYFGSSFNCEPHGGINECFKFKII